MPQRREMVSVHAGSTRRAGARRLLGKFQRYELRGGVACVDDGLAESEGEPEGVPGHEVGGGWDRSVPIVRAGILGEEIGIGERYQQHRVSGRTARDNCCRLEFEFGDADSVFDEEDFLRAALEDIEASVFIGVRGVRVSGRLAKFFVLQQFDGDVAEGLVGLVAGDVGEGGGAEVGLAVGEFDGDGIFAFHRVDDFGGAQRDVNVVVAVPVHERVGVRRDVDVEDADMLVDEDLVVVGLGGDLDLGRGLRG